MKHQQQNNDQTKIHLGFNILQNISRKELTKLQLQILPELQLQNLDQTLYFNTLAKDQRQENGEKRITDKFSKRLQRFLIS